MLLPFATPVSQLVPGSQRSGAPSIDDSGNGGMPGRDGAARDWLAFSCASMTAAVRMRSEYSSRERTRAVCGRAGVFGSDDEGNCDARDGGMLRLSGGAWDVKGSGLSV